MCVFMRSNRTPGYWAGPWLMAARFMPAIPGFDRIPSIGWML